MSGAPRFTTDRRLGPGEALRAGADSDYRAVALVPGEAHLVRDELVGPDVTGSGAGRALAVLAHVTDLQLADVQSPTRFEFLNRGFGDPRYRKIIPVQRPQEALTAHAVEATLRTLNRLPGGPISGAPLQLVVTTGDAIDNGQWNELQAFLALFHGGQVRLDSGGPAYEGVQSPSWPDDIFWVPDGRRDAPDRFVTQHGFPVHPGLLEQALREFSADGLRVPWLACFGNHEGLNQGVGAITPALAAALTGDRKPVRLVDDFDHDRVYDVFIDHPEELFRAEVRQVTADPARRPVSRREFVEAHFRPEARPVGHGFTEHNLRAGTAYYAYDTSAARLVALDTTCLDGGADGCLDHAQARWLEERLVEAHSHYRTRSGDTVATGNDDRLVVLFSHHGLDNLTNERAHVGPDGEPALGAAELLAVVHRFPNVVLWLNGHTHTNGVRLHRDPQGPGAFWEVTTCAVVDWPCQTRVVELVDRGDGTLAIGCTMLDHDSPLAGGAGGTVTDLAALHRELAGNVPWSGFDSPMSGTAADRNVDLRLPAPFPLDRLPA